MNCIGLLLIILMILLIIFVRTSSTPNTSAPPQTSERTPLYITTTDRRVDSALGQLLGPPKPEDGLTLDNFLKVASDSEFELHLEGYKTNFSHLFDFAQDGCSVPQQLDFEFLERFKLLFTPACIQHDFGYRNAYRVGYRDRETIDLIWLDQMKNKCNMLGILDRVICKAQATTFFEIVRLFGEFAFKTADSSASPGIEIDNFIAFLREDKKRTYFEFMKKREEEVATYLTNIPP